MNTIFCDIYMSWNTKKLGIPHYSAVSRNALPLRNSSGEQPVLRRKKRHIYDASSKFSRSAIPETDSRVSIR